MIFSGSYQSPVVVQTPGFIPPFPNNPNGVNWGEDVSISIPDPGENCTLLLQISTPFGVCRPHLQKSYERTSDLGDITFSFSGVEFRKYLKPGIYAFIATKIKTGGIDGANFQYQFYPEGTIEINESPGSFGVSPDESTDFHPSLMSSLLSTEMYLSGATGAAQVFGFYRSSLGVAISVAKITIAAQTAPVGADLVLNLIDGNGDLITAATLPDGTDVVEIPVSGVSIPAGGVIRCRVVSTGSTTPAEGVQVKVDFRV